MRHFMLTAPRRASIRDKSIARMREMGAQMPEIVMGTDFSAESVQQRLLLVTEMHVDIWKNVLKTGETAVVYEDDAYYLRKHAIVEPSGASLFFLGVHYARFKDYERNGVSLLYSFSGSHAYVVNKYCASVLLSSHKGIVDHWMSYFVSRNRLIGEVPTPYVCCQSSHASGIDSARPSEDTMLFGMMNSGGLISCSELRGD